MIQNSFIMLDRIGNITEKRIYEQGINDWDSFLETDKIKGMSERAKPYYNRKIKEAKSALYNLDSKYFLNLIPQSETWRLYDFFKEDAVFLDIEASGLGEKDIITMIGLFDGINTKTMIRGINFDLNCLKRELARYKLIVTFNGATFDIPFINKRYLDLIPEIPHFDLRTACERVGLKGGLKNIEKQIGIKRNSKIVEKMYGGDALALWRMHRATGDDYYLRLLVEYNEEDVINLKKIADYVVERMKEKSLNKLTI